MATKFNDERSEERTFSNHPAGTFLARCVDVYTEEKANPYKGKKSINPRTQAEEVDDRETLTKVRIKFLTEETIDINGSAMPRMVMYFGNMSWGDNSKLRGFVKGFAPDVAKLAKWEVDLDALIGREAMVTVSEWDNGDGTSVTIASQVHASMAGKAPAIPAGFQRKQ